MAHRTTWTTTTPANPLVITTSTTAGDTLVAYVVNDNSTVQTYTWPSGFVEQFVSQTTTDGMNVACAIKKNATGSEGALTITPSGSTHIGGISAYSGRDTTTQPDVTSVSVVENANENPPSTTGTIVPTTNGCDIVGIYGLDTSGTVNATTFSGGGLTWTTRADVNNGAFYNVSCGDAPQTTAASIGVTGTGTVNAAKVLFLIALRPAAGGGPTQDQIWPSIQQGILNPMIGRRYV